MHCLGGNATDLISRVLASSDGISSWTPLKPQHSNPNRLASQLWCIDFLTPAPHLSLSLTDSLPSLNLLCHSKTDAQFIQDFCGIFPSLKQNFIAYCSSSCRDCIFEIYQLWQSGFSRMYSNSCCSCSFEAEIIRIGQSSHKMYSNNIVNFQECTTILNAHTKNVWKLIVCASYFYWIKKKKNLVCLIMSWKINASLIKNKAGSNPICKTILWVLCVYPIYSNFLRKVTFKC